MKPTRHKFTILKQIMEIIPPYLVSKLAREHGVDKKSRKIRPWSHVLSLIFAQISHALSLNDICDTLRFHCGALSTIRGASAPSRNGLSNANRVRNADMAEDLFGSENEMIKVGLFELIDALQKILENLAPDERVDLTADRISVKDKISQLVDILEKEKSITLNELFTDAVDKSDVIITFLAILEMVKLSLLRIVQHVTTGIIRLFYI